MGINISISLTFCTGLRIMNLSTSANCVQTSSTRSSFLSLRHCVKETRARRGALRINTFFSTRHAHPTTVCKSMFIEWDSTISFSSILHQLQLSKFADRCYTPGLTQAQYHPHLPQKFQFWEVVGQNKLPTF